MCLWLRILPGSITRLTSCAGALLASLQRATRIARRRRADQCGAVLVVVLNTRASSFSISGAHFCRTPSPVHGLMQHPGPQGDEGLCGEHGGARLACGTKQAWLVASTVGRLGRKDASFAPHIEIPSFPRWILAGADPS
ncbi:hypothetical protein FB567DRAFT_544112 [Paraphoma chrysanthemicola]|uniref:Secreted protein n=1 Tax=Paraphoma chrysanthemicola TaxID=798071 RepID=A0A8K0W5E9_9PLEO|nr:hypothetical protein FB567DRAFT_544112 [Paraphoma chrysanthemicola]